METFRNHKGELGEVIVTDGDAQIANEVFTLRGWDDYATNFFPSIPEDTRSTLMGPTQKTRFFTSAWCSRLRPCAFVDVTSW